MFDFYSSILNLNRYDLNKSLSMIGKIINDERNSVLEYTNDFEGLCKVFGYNIKNELENINFKVNLVNIHNLNNNIGDHIFLVTYFKDLEDKTNYILIDPTYIQFCKKDNNKVYKFNDWPGEILKEKNSNLYKSLISDGFSLINSNDFNDYISSFGINNFSLEDVILKKYKEDDYEISKRNHT